MELLSETNEIKKKESVSESLLQRIKLRQKELFSLIKNKLIDENLHAEINGTGDIHLFTIPREEITISEFDDSITLDLVISKELLGTFCKLHYKEPPFFIENVKYWLDEELILDYELNSPIMILNDKHDVTLTYTINLHI